MEERSVFACGLLHTPAHVSIRQHTYIIRQHTSAYVLMEERSAFACGLLHVGYCRHRGLVSDAGIEV